MNDRTLASQFQACSAALSAGQPQEAQRLLAALDAGAMAPAAAALHRQLSRLVAQAIDRIAHPDAAVASKLPAPLPSTIPSLLAFDQSEPFPGVSLVSACMNRQDNLLKVLPSWLASDADEIIIVDWSSADPVAPMLAHIDDPRLRVVRIDGEPRWILTHAFNVGLRLARHALVYKLDADIQLLPSFFIVNHIGPGEFVRGFWKTAVDHGQDDQKYVNGSFGACKSDLRAAGYYNERIRTYGWDDSDLYHRLSHAMGLAGRLLQHGSLLHLPQSDVSRTAHQDIGRKSFMGWFDPTDHENAVNKFHTAISLDWTAHDPAQDFELQAKSGRMLVGQRITAIRPLAAEDRDLAGVLATRQLIAWHGRPLFEGALSTSESMEFARLLKQAHDAGLGPRLLDALTNRRGLHLIDASTAVFRQLAEQTVELILSHRATAAEVIIIVTDDGYRPGAMRSSCPQVLRASTALLEVLSKALGTQPEHDLQRLETALAAGPKEACMRWDVSEQGIATSALAHAQTIAANLSGQFHNAAQSIPRTSFVTSVYDESNLLRLVEYLACVSLNLRVFDRLLLLYEARTGLFLAVMQEMVRLLQIAPARLVMLPFGHRPTFEELFSVHTALPDGTLLVVGNADVAFDVTLEALASSARDDEVYVLSRRDISNDGRRAHLIRMESGIPNIYSADAWIARTPFNPDFSLDYPIGSFHCDSFINNQLNRSQRYRWANPCLDINVFHLHDSRFNSSAEKNVRDRERIEHQYRLERERSGGNDPVKGAPWSTISQAAILGNSQNFLIGQRPRSLVLDSTAHGIDLATLLWLEVVRPAVESDGHTVAVVRMRRGDSDGPLGQLIAQYKAHFQYTSLLVELDDYVYEEGAATKHSVQVRHINVELLLDCMINGDAGRFAAELAALMAWPSDAPQITQLRIDWPSNLSQTQTLDLATAIRMRHPAQLEQFLGFIGSLGRWSDQFRVLQPLVDDFGVPTSAPALVGLNQPTVSLVTSLFRGDEFLPGFLENAAQAAQTANGEVVLVDANCNGHDTEAINRFFRARPELRRHFDIVQMDKDPGLYACWRIAIERARGEFISNTNLDDRRSPQHTRRLVQALQSRPHLAGGAGSISAVFRRALGHWFELHPNQVWFHDLGAREFGFEDLFARNEDGTVRSHNIMHCMPVWRRSLHQRFGYFDEDRYGTSADWAFWLKCAREGERFWLDPQAFGRYYVNPNSHNRRNDIDGMKERRIVLDLIGEEQSSIIKQ